MHANARRLGIMYMIWNRRIWSSYKASSGWRKYSGSNPHTDPGQVPRRQGPLGAGLRHRQQGWSQPPAQRGRKKPSSARPPRRLPPPPQLFYRGSSRGVRVGLPLGCSFLGGLVLVGLIFFFFVAIFPAL